VSAWFIYTPYLHRPPLTERKKVVISPCDSSRGSLPDPEQDGPGWESTRTRFRGSPSWALTRACASSQMIIAWHRLARRARKDLACLVLHDFVAPPLEPLVPDRAIPHLAGLLVLGLSRLDLKPCGIGGHGENHGVPAVPRFELACGGAWHLAGWTGGVSRKTLCGVTLGPDLASRFEDPLRTCVFADVTAEFGGRPRDRPLG